jgi:hypothetical protein
MITLQLSSQNTKIYFHGGPEGFGEPEQKNQEEFEPLPKRVEITVYSGPGMGYFDNEDDAAAARAEDLADLEDEEELPPNK